MIRLIWTDLIGWNTCPLICISNHANVDLNDGPVGDNDDVLPVQCIDYVIIKLGLDVVNYWKFLIVVDTWLMDMDWYW